jgi:ATP-binding cassette subfamily F protein 3
VIDFQQVSKSFGSQEVLREASFRANDGERVGIVGPNGAGKSTIFSLIRGQVTPDAGSIELPRGARIGHLRQEFNPHEVTEDLLEYAESGREDLHEILAEIHRLHDAEQDEQTLNRIGELQTRFEASGGYQARAEAEAALSGLGFTDEDSKRPFRSFSGGWQMRAELARVLVAAPDVLLLDEPTNYLDIPAIEWLRKFLKGFNGTMLLISHDRYLLNSLTRVTVEIANVVATKYAGNYDFYAKDRVLRYEQRLAASKNLDRRKKEIERFIERFRSKNTKAAQVQSRIKMLEKMVDIELPQSVVSPGKMRLKDPVRSGQEVIRLEDVGFAYDEDRWVLRGVDMRIDRGQKVALVGLNGMGKSTLLRVLTSHLAPQEGKRVLGHKVAIGYQSQEFAETMNPDLTVFETVRSMGPNSSTQEIRTLLGGFGFPGETVDKSVSVLSGGEKVRLAFARLLADPPNFLILDEPTTHLDIAAREALEGALQDYKGTICVVSHDIDFVRNVADTIIEMQPPGIRRYYGGYDYYREKVDGEAPAQADVAKKSAGGDRKARRRERAQKVQALAKQKRKLQTQVTKHETRIDELENAQWALTERLQKGGENMDHEATNRRLSEIHDELNKVTVLWEQAAGELERVGRPAVDDNS